MKIWVDAQLPPAIAPWIGARFGIKCVHLREAGIGVTDDLAIFQLLRTRADESPVILTKDEDFANLVTRLQPPPQVLWMRVGNVTNRALREYLPRVLPQAMEALNEGVALVELARLR
ncbi:MAG: DUF5615 family PIN-like protein [Phycisphaeraceae bacterium]|nr:DUF5615 family PIN-like protein [Phycisphaeraceae bacterium]MBX3406725.1 DUF5615 family PIN-like protein [Phycisphaeraceae bacterium]